MALEVEGVLHKKFDTESKTDTFQTREFVIKTDGTYPQFVKFQLVQDRCSAIDPYNEGDNIKVSFDLRGREWNGKYFTNLNAWRIEKVESEGGNNFPPEEPPFGNFPEAGDDDLMNSKVDDLPF